VGKNWQSSIKDYGTANGTNDGASRIGSLIDNDGTTHLADYSYLGVGVIVIDDYSQPQTKYTLADINGNNDPDTGDIYSGLDRFSRVKDLHWYNYGSDTDSVRIQHGYDRAGNRLWRQDPVAVSNGAAFDELCAYDGLDRLKNMQRGTLNAGHTAVTAGTATFAQCWSLDSTGNWQGFREDDNGDGSWDLVQSRSANPVNEISGITNSVGSAWASPVYDKAGNLTTIPQPASPSSSYTGTYDAWNRLVTLVQPSNGNLIQTNSYDGRNYRAIRDSYSSGVLSEARHYFYTSSWQAIDERVGTSNSAERQFVWGQRFTDDLVLRDRDTSGGGILNERMYALQDPLGSVVAAVNASGTVRERYGYSPYGAPLILSPIFAVQTTDAFDWETRFAGYRFDSTRLHIARHRFLNSSLGTWLTQDPLGYSGSAFHLYAYASNSPVARSDPFGLASVDAGRGLYNCESCLVTLFYYTIFGLSPDQYLEVVMKTRVIEPETTNSNGSFKNKAIESNPLFEKIKDIALAPGTGNDAITLGNLVYTGELLAPCMGKENCECNQKATDLLLMAHELVHRVQFAKLGEKAFITDYVADYTQWRLRNAKKLAKN